MKKYTRLILKSRDANQDEEDHRNRDRKIRKYNYLLGEYGVTVSHD